MPKSAHILLCVKIEENEEIFPHHLKLSAGLLLLNSAMHLRTLLLKTP